MDRRPISKRETFVAESRAPEFCESTLRKAMAGDKDAFAALFDAHYDFIYRVAFRHASNQSDAEDIAQDTCLKLARALGSYRFEAAFTTWLYRLTANVAKDFHRKAYRRKEKAWSEHFDVSDRAPSPERVVAGRELLGAVETLPDKLKAAVLLVFRDGLSHRQAADALGCAENTVSWRIFEARKALAVLVEPDQPEGPRHA